MKDSEISMRQYQRNMHKDFYDRSKTAIEAGFYLEAIFLEYAAIEGRLEIILGMLGLPCNKDLEIMTRKEVRISSRIKCLNQYRKNCPTVFNASKLEWNFFSSHGKMNRWIRERNTFIHGLYKDAATYNSRKHLCREIAEDGLKIARGLYNEARRIRRMRNTHPELLEVECRICQNENCAAYTKIQKE